jgi:hypothetical protein
LGIHGLAIGDWIADWRLAIGVLTADCRLAIEFAIVNPHSQSSIRIPSIGTRQSAIRESAIFSRQSAMTARYYPFHALSRRL